MNDLSYNHATMQPLPRPAEKRLLILLLIAFVILGFIYALITPAFEASDELWHYPMVRHLADGNPLPVQVFDPAQAGPWKQEASQPPLYYYLAAALTFWIDTGDMETARRLNPHVDNGLITEDGNINLAIHDPAADPWQGTLLAVRLVRLFSVLLGAATVYLTYRIGREVAPGRPEIALGAAAANAFLPMFLFISGAVNNDNLAVPLASLALLLMMRIIDSRTAAVRPFRAAEWLILGVVIGLAVLTKEGTLGLLPLAAGTAFVAAWRQAVRLPKGGESGARRDESGGRTLSKLLGRAVLAGLLVLLPALLIAGWWYYRNWTLYGDWLGWNAFVAVLGRRAHPASLLQLWGERRGFLMSYWGLFGGVNVPMADWVYAVFNAVLVLSAIGFAIYFVQLIRDEVRRWRSNGDEWLRKAYYLLERHFALLICLLFVAAVVFGLIQWATTTWSSQGRLVFTAISPISVLMVLGLVGWLPRRPATIGAGALALFMFAIALVAPFVWIRPAYRPPVVSDSLPLRLDENFDDYMRLVGYQVDRTSAQPGEPLWVRLEWEVMREMDRDWSVFVHLNDPVLARPIAQRDMYPGQGLLATRLLKPGQRLINSYRLMIPSTAVAPAELQLATGLYDYYSGERLQTKDGEDAVTLGTVLLAPATGEQPNSLSVRFENGLELVGFEVRPRRLLPGEATELVTYWQTGEPLPADYTFFAQIVDKDTTRWASLDAAPPEPTTTWQPGRVYRLSLPLSLSPDTPPDVYPLILGLYTRTADGGFDRLQILAEDGRLTDDFLNLTQIRVDEQ